MPLYFFRTFPCLGVSYIVYTAMQSLNVLLFFSKGEQMISSSNSLNSVCERKISHTVKIELFVLSSGGGCNFKPIPSTCKNKQQIRNNSQTNGNSIKHGLLLGAQCKFHLPQQLHKTGWGCSTPQHVFLSLWNMEKLAIPSSFTSQISNKYRHTLHIGNCSWLKGLDRMYNKLWSFHDPLVINPLVTNLYMRGNVWLWHQSAFFTSLWPYGHWRTRVCGDPWWSSGRPSLPLRKQSWNSPDAQANGFLEKQLDFAKNWLLAYWLQGHTFIKRRWGLGWKIIPLSIMRFLILGLQWWPPWWNHVETASCKAVSVVTSHKLKVPRVIST